MLVNTEGAKDDLPTLFERLMSRSDSYKRLEALNPEIDSLSKLGTWVLTPMPQGWRVIKIKWVLH